MNEKTERSISLQKRLFYFCLASFVGSAMLKQVSALGDIVGYIYQASLFVLLLTCLLTISHLPRKQMLFMYSMTLLMVIIRLTTSSNMLLAIWLFAIAGREIEFKDIIKLDFRVRLVLLILVGVLYFAGLTFVNLHYRDGGVRHSMGFSNPNVFSTHVLVLASEIIYLRKNKIGIKEILMALVAMVIINYFADSRTQIICLIGVVILTMIHERKTSKEKTERDSAKKHVGIFFRKHAFTLLTILSLTLALLNNTLVNSDILKSINSITSGRVNAASSKLEEYDIKLFGQKVSIINSAQAARTGLETTPGLDNAYVYFILEFGVISTVLMCYFMREYMECAQKNQDLIGYIMAVFLVGGLMEHFAIEPQLNIFLLYFSQVLYGNPQKFITKNSTVIKRKGTR